MFQFDLFSSVFSNGCSDFLFYFHGGFRESFVGAFGTHPKRVKGIRGEGPEVMAVLRAVRSGIVVWKRDGSGERKIDNAKDSRVIAPQ